MKSTFKIDIILDSGSRYGITVAIELVQRVTVRKEKIKVTPPLNRRCLYTTFVLLWRPPNKWGREEAGGEWESAVSIVQQLRTYRNRTHRMFVFGNRLNSAGKVSANDSLDSPQT